MCFKPTNIIPDPTHFFSDIHESSEQYYNLEVWQRAADIQWTLGTYVYHSYRIRNAGEHKWIDMQSNELYGRRG